MLDSIEMVHAIAWYWSHQMWEKGNVKIFENPCLSSGVIFLSCEGKKRDFS